MPPCEVDALLVDFYGTISAGDREAVEATCRGVVETCTLPVTAPQLAVLWGERFFAEIERSNHGAFRNLYECEVSSLHGLLRDFGVQTDPAPLVTTLEEYWANPPVYPDAVEFLRHVDLPTCCVSNADTIPLLAAIERHALHFDAVVTSEAARCYKPGAEIFRRALRELGIPPDRALHIGDSLHSDVAGASGLGIVTAWLRRPNRIHDVGNCQPDYTISTFSELRALICV